MKVVMAEKPTLLALGESHAPRGATGVDSVTKRTTEQLLPLVASRASDFVIELWVGDPSCDRKAVAAAASQAKDVSAKQAESNPNEFVALAQAAKQAGARPHTLRPSCADYEAVRKAGPDGILVMLETVARTMGDELERLATGPHPAGRPLVVGYGGAMHNDVEPRPGRESWSYGPRLSKVKGVAYVELDLIVPEYIRDDATWRSLAWHALYDPAAEPSRFTLFRTAQKAFTLVFPRTGEGAPR